MSAGLVGAAGTPAGESSSLCCLPRRKTVNQVTSPHPFSHVSCNSVITRIDLLEDDIVVNAAVTQKQPCVCFCLCLSLDSLRKLSHIPSQ